MTEWLPTHPVPAPRTRGPIPAWAKAATVGVAAVVMAGAFLGVGMAISSKPSSGMSMSTPASGTAAPAGQHATKAKDKRKVDPARQAWAHKYGVDRARMSNLAPVASASAAQQAAATSLLNATEAATSKYRDLATAKAAGFDLQAALVRVELKRPKLADMLKIDVGTMPAMTRMPMLHVANKANRTDGKVLDPNAPETLMYEYSGHGNWKLIGVMYTANESYPAAPPDPGGPIMRWHYHDKSGGQSLMMHLFFVSDLAHAYAAEMS